MTEYQFSLAMDKLRNVYGDRAYPSERSEIIFRTVEECDGSSFSNFVEGLIARERQPPMIDKFIEFSNSDRANKRRAERLALREGLADGTLCPQCADDGRVLGVRNADGAFFAFLCNRCENAKTNGYANVSINEPGTPFQSMAYWRDDLTSMFTLKTPAEMLR